MNSRISPPALATASALLLTPLVLALLAASPSAADATAANTTTAEITLEQIMADPEWIARTPENGYWGEGGDAIYYRRERKDGEERDLYRLDLGSGEAQVVEAKEMRRAGAPGGDVGPERRHRVYERRGDIYLENLESGESRQLTRTSDDERNPRFLAGGGRITFERGGDVWIRELESGLEYHPAQILLQDDPAEEEEPDDYLGEQQLRLFEVLRDRKERLEGRREADLEERSGDPSRVPPPWYLGEEIEIRSRSLSPREERMLLVTVPASGDEGPRDQMPNYVTETGYVVLEEVRPKVGNADGRSESFWLLDLESHERHELDLSVLPGISEDPLAEIAARNAEEDAEQDTEESTEGEEGEKDADEKEEESAKPRPVGVEAIEWSPDGRWAAIQIHSHDNKDRWIALLEAGSQELQTIHHLHDEAWINWFFNDLGWLDGGRLYFLSEESGFSQLYLYDPEEGSTRRLSSGEGVVWDPVPGPEHRFIYYASNAENPGITEIYRVSVENNTIDDDAVEQLTDLGGQNRDPRISPRGDAVLFDHSEALQPTELYLQPLEKGTEARRLTHTVSESFEAMPWVAPRYVEVPSSYVERPIHSRLYLPPEGAPPPGPEGLRPAVIFIHGAGYLQNAHRGWSPYFREFMFHSLLARKGYVVLDMDYRASAGYGRDWRTAIYRHMGGPELEDLADGVDYLAAEHGVDRERVGVYGGSYGGFLTFMALFQRPELFACGASLRPVTDWAHYNHPYTSNILNTPEIDPEAYERSSPIEFAEGLEKPLLIAHGMQDDNVLFQDTVRLVQRLIELGKTDWEVAIYPLEPHGFVEPSSWFDEYRRILKLFETHLQP